MDEQVAERLESIGLRDHSNTAEYRIFGPPGTGKTTNLSRQIRRAVDRFGDNSVLATSFSKAAAVELTDRDTPIDLDRIGTLHSFCFQALGKPMIAEVYADDWNRQQPRLKVTPVSRQVRLDGEDSADDDRQPRAGDRLLQQLNRCRGLMLNPETWPAVVRDFATQWTKYKSANGLLDFSDLIEVSLRDVHAAPHRPSVLVVDEAQDLNRMQLTLIRSWSERAQYLLLGGDDDQSLYGWAGASPDAILDPDIPDDHKVFLKDSVRVPRTVHAVAERLIRQVSRRQEKTYHPRPAEGEVVRLSWGGYRSPEYGILKTAEQHLARGKTIMFLASCSYMLQPIIAILRQRGIPFHNPYRQSNGFWNPIRINSPRSAARRLLALLGVHGASVGDRSWTHRSFSLWAEWLRPGVLNPEAREVLTMMATTATITAEVLKVILQPTALASLLECSTGEPQSLARWWRGHLAPEFNGRVQFPVDVLNLGGPAALQNKPQIVIGSIHSVKGGQADVVYLFPDLSAAGDDQYSHSGAARDSVIRTFYVGVTRTRETLYLCSPAGHRAVKI